MAGRAILPYYNQSRRRDEILPGFGGPRAQPPRLLLEDPAALSGYPNSFLLEDNNFMLLEG